MQTTKYIINELSAQKITGDLNVIGSLSGSTVSTDKFYGDGSNIGGVVGLNYNELGFTITSLPSGINQDVVLPYNATVTYPTPLIMNNGYVLTIPSGTTLTII